MLARCLGSQLVLLSDVESVEPVLEVGYPLAVRERLGSGFIVPRDVRLVDHIDRERLVPIVVLDRGLLLL